MVEFICPTCQTRPCCCQETQTTGELKAMNCNTCLYQTHEGQCDNRYTARETCTGRGFNWWRPIKSEQEPATKHDQGKPDITPLLEVKMLPALAEIAKVRLFGIKKYGKENIWKGGLSIRRLIAASQRHCAAFLDGEALDPESGRHHLAHAAISIIFALAFALAGIGKDDHENE